MPEVRHRGVEGSLAFVDISGFTTLTERLAAKGKVGAEEMSDLLNEAFATLLKVAYGYGASLVKWGGDAVLLLYEGSDHAAQASRASLEMQRTMRRIGRLRTSVGVVTLKMSVGISSGTFDFFLVGDGHRELLVAGPAATQTAVMEQIAEAGEVVVSAAWTPTMSRRASTRHCGRICLPRWATASTDRLPSGSSRCPVWTVCSSSRGRARPRVPCTNS
jgi:class 3 adenylate cyclase